MITYDDLYPPGSKPGILYCLLKSSLRKLLEMAMYESFFIFNQKYYKQCNGFPTGIHIEQCLYVSF